MESKNVMLEVKNNVLLLFIKKKENVIEENYSTKLHQFG